jgi:hypothetical protein
MRRILLGLCGVLMAMVGWSAVSHAADADAPKTVQGELIDMHCYAAGGARGDGHASCAAKCMKSGIPAGILVDGKAWTLLTNPTSLAAYAAKTIRVTGTVDKETQTVAPDKIEVKQGDQWKEVKMSDAHHGADKEG